MSRLAAAILALIAFGAGIGAGVLGLLWATGGNATPSKDVGQVAPTLSLNSPTPAGISNDALSTQIAQVSAQLNALATQVGGLSVAASAPTAAVTIQPTTAAAAPNTAAVTRALFRIDSNESEARFSLNETLFGNPNLVVGKTRRVAGDIIVNLAQPSGSQVGQIAVSARTLKTDNEFRDQSIRGQILASSQDEFEFVTFTPTELKGLSASPVAAGDTLTFQIVGDLTMRGVTRSVTFEASVKLASETRLEGLATVEIAYAEWGITVEAPPTVADVDKTVKLELQFVALRVEQS
jgi:polyisoprenoid-binding protein YceI